VKYMRRRKIRTLAILPGSVIGLAKKGRSAF